MTIARDLGTGPHKPFGSALPPHAGGKAPPIPRVGRTVKPRSLGPCKVCGERRFFCECESGDD